MILRAMAKSFTATIRKASDERYRRYANAKSRIPLNIPPAEYEKEVRRLARLYRI